MTEGEDQERSRRERAASGGRAPEGAARDEHRHSADAPHQNRAAPEKGDQDGGGSGFLNQQEIDSLLGLADEGARPRSGVSLLVDNDIVSYERLPMLEVVFDRLVRIKHEPAQLHLGERGRRRRPGRITALQGLSRLPRFAAIARPTSAAILFRLKVEMEDRGGHLQILIPYATLEPARDLLLQMFLGEKFGRDSIWESHLAKEMLVTRLELEALLEEQMLPLSTVMQLAVGTTLPLNARPDSPITVRCGHVPLLRGRIGRVGEHIAVRVEDRIERGDAERS